MRTQAGALLAPHMRSMHTPPLPKLGIPSPSAPPPPAAPTVSQAGGPAHVWRWRRAGRADILLLCFTAPGGGVGR